jgi:hypothetical protein
MPNSPLNSSAPLREAMLELLWLQWSALGVAGHVTGGGRALIDPEALVLASTVFARHDARLFDEMFDWLRGNGTWINVMRLTRLHREHALGDATVLGALAEHLSQDSAHLKWKALAKSPELSPESRPLFPHLAVLNRTDEIFRRWGWLRPPVENRGLSRPPRPNQPATFLLKLRALFGRQSRAEVFAWLLTHESGHPAQIARETGYFRGSVQGVLNELEHSGQIQATREGREKHFALRRDEWRFLLSWEKNLSADFPRWLPWAGLFALFAGVYQLLETPGFAQYSADLQAIELNRVVTPLAGRLAAEGYPAHFAAVSPGQDPAGDLLAALRRLLVGLGE